MLTPRNPRDHYLIRDIILKRNGIKSYEDYLNSKRWADIRKQSKEAKYKGKYSKCIICGTKRNINLHHSTYDWIFTGRELSSIKAICEVHHNELHDLAYRERINLLRH